MRDNAKRLAEFGKSKLDVTFRLADFIEEVTDKADILSTTTTSSSPILDASMIREGTHINAVGSNLPSRKELDPSLLRAAKIVVDSTDQAIEESGDLEPIKQGKVPRIAIYSELSEILVGRKRGRTTNSEITVFKSVGLAVQDIAAAQFIYEKAVKNKVGREVRL